MSISKIMSISIAVAALTGCAHPLVISPDLTKVERTESAQPLKKNVGYYFSDELRTKEITTPGGGGDKVSYQPYRDIETAFYKMLSNIFGNVTKLKLPNDQEVIAKNRIDYVISPEIVTNSSSPSPFTWPPTQFTVQLTCNITDPSGRQVTTKKVLGSGNAEFDEFKKDFSLSGKRASLDALLKMQHELLDAPELK